MVVMGTEIWRMVDIDTLGLVRALQWMGENFLHLSDGSFRRWKRLRWRGLTLTNGIENIPRHESLGQRKYEALDIYLSRSAQEGPNACAFDTRFLHDGNVPPYAR